MRRIKLNTLVGGLCCLVLVWVLFNWVSRPQSEKFRAQQNDPGENNEEKQGRKAQEFQQERAHRPPEELPPVSTSTSVPPGPSFKPIPCSINAEVKKNLHLVPGGGEKDKGQEECFIVQEPLEEEEKALVPFSLVKKYFDIYGDLKYNPNGSATLEWSHSYSKVFPALKDTPYRYNGTFMTFANSDVELRSRVKCVTASENVPLSTQWDKAGYYYPTQIAQYGLSHWSKHVPLRVASVASTSSPADSDATPPLTRTVYENGAEDILGNWHGDTTRSNCVHFDTASEIWLDSLDNAREFFLDLSLQYKQNVTVTVILKSPSMGYELRYVQDDEHVKREGNVVSYGYGSKKYNESDWLYLRRNLLTDLAKGLSKRAFKPFKKQGSVSKIILSGVGCVANFSLASSGHLEQFFHAADWFVRNQMKDLGGWPIQITFNKNREKYSQAEEIQPGWHSAMATGQSISVLARAYSYGREEKYYDAALKAIAWYKLRQRESGFQAVFMEKYIWFEEYPTDPPTFVLNGFMYSLMGLFDFILIPPDGDEEKLKVQADVTELLESAMLSLTKMLPLYDTGARTVYDLRHFTMVGQAPKIARWDYHSCHVNQLYTLASATSDPEVKDVLLTVAERWRGYMIGKIADHN